MYICVCNRVTDKQIREAARDGARTLDALSAQLKVASCCGKCRGCARRVLREAMAHQTAPFDADLVPALAAT